MNRRHELIPGSPVITAKVGSHLSVLGFFQSFQTAAMPNGSWPGIVNSYFGFFLPFSTSCHS